jgi:hypothetical protein
MRAWRTRRAVSGTVEVKRRQGLHLDHPHGSNYKPQHQNLEEVAGERVHIDEAVGAAATDDVDGGNDF